MNLPKMIASMKKRTYLKDLEAGEYALSTESDAWCYCKCPKCGKLTKIIKAQHDINYLGELYPKVSCPYQCGFSGQMIFEEWIPEAKGQA